MSVKAKPAEEDPETKVRRELAEARAESGRLDELGDNVSTTTQAIIRKFGRINGASLAPRFSLTPNISGGTSTSGGGGGGGSTNGSSVGTPSYNSGTQAY